MDETSMPEWQVVKADFVDAGPEHGALTLVGESLCHVFYWPAEASAPLASMLNYVPFVHDPY